MENDAQLPRNLNSRTWEFENANGYFKPGMMQFCPDLQSFDVKESTIVSMKQEEKQDRYHEENPIGFGISLCGINKFVVQYGRTNVDIRYTCGHMT